MIEIDCRYIFVFVLILSIGGFVLYKYLYRLSILTFEIDKLNADVDSFKKKSNTLKEEKNILEKKLLTSINNEKSLNIEILQLKRLIDKTEITKEELNYFANNQDNDIRLDKCHENAPKVFQKFGGKIIIGSASFRYKGMKTNTNHIEKHFWNEHIYQENGKELVQLIDIANYKENLEKIYYNHTGIEVNIKEIGDKDLMYKYKEKVKLLIDENKMEELRTYSNDNL
ncbi:MAG: hypothetical protein Q7S59_03920 [Sulfurimonas sp.]|nr:hypothetical protein [Sulfurimonas sp.]